MNIVVVESPAKAKTINQYLGSDYRVVASYGHVRDLAAKDGSVVPEADFAMSWEILDASEKHIASILKAARGAKRLYLATDPDREGEAISWHLFEVLRDRRALKDVEVKRVSFNEVTRSAVLEAFSHPRAIDRELVEAYLARRALDYLVGFTLSPVLWRKLPGSRSAGRVQSVALRLVCEREALIEAFKPREFWTVEVLFKTGSGSSFWARLTHLDGKRLEKFDLDTKDKAEAAVAAVGKASGFAVAAIERRQLRRNPDPPFTTSTLQQEASLKLGLGAARTMQIAQRLYEGVDLGGESVGLITYMRTDGVAISGEAIAAARRLIGRDFGDRYLPPTPRLYKSPAKNAQEAHEAIRPTDLGRRPGAVARHLSPEQSRLYELIWRRTLASQMASALIDQVSVDIADKEKRLGLHAVGSVVAFDGFLALYQEEREEEGEEEGEGRALPPLKEGEPLSRGGVAPRQHFTLPPPRYSEASLVKKLEELGIGRPSTYASILQVLQDRDYVRLEKRRFVPEDRGRIVTAFLANFFERYIEYSFTADLENRLDEVSAGRSDWKDLLRAFWRDFSAAVEETRELSIKEVIAALDAELGRHFFPDDGSGRDPRLCPSCGSGRQSLKLGRFGAFIGCSNYPSCRFTRPLGLEGESEGAAAETVLGIDPQSGCKIALKKGPYGQYVEAIGEGEGRPKRVALPRSLKPADVDLEIALSLLALPRELGRHPESGEPIFAGIGRFGPYLRHRESYCSLGPEDDVLTIGLNRAVVLLAQGKGGRRRASEPLRTLGDHPEGGAVAVYRGRYGPYVRHGRSFASLPREADPDRITLEEGLALIAAQRAKEKTRGKEKGAPAKRAQGAPGRKSPPGADGKAAKAQAKPPGKTKTAAGQTRKSARKKPQAKLPSPTQREDESAPAARRRPGR